ncbi:uncharacterized protein LOC106165799 [Lingula anatina]|uniref:Uncharacterized protein LOC106165799 n=1 Tax=Lingula anatina TaxID=7574 RepID=A0A1S3INY9_LINAN|nr:uncharacterized protein LOC106165799 [Lingula anatina]|eukprot:XP_013399611.1 uncharacterized protein LOC106165799 [Lingula anatina]
MDYHLKEHYDVKSPIDMACWDILGKHSKLPLCTLLGGRYGESVKLHYHVGQNTPEKTREIVTRFKNEGFECFQLKVGSNPTQDIQRVREIRKMLDPSNILMVDPNTAWLPHQAIRFANAVQDLDVYLEQPCASYEENLHVRRYTNLPFILDESTVDVVRLMQGGLGQVAQGVVLKMGRLGGVTKTKQARDLCVNLGIAARIEDPWGGEIASAAIAHLAHSTPEKYRIPSIDLNNYNSVKIAEGGPVRVNGTIAANKGPGLGITPCMDVLGDPVLTM